MVGKAELFLTEIIQRWHWARQWYTFALLLKEKLISGHVPGLADNPALDLRIKRLKDSTNDSYIELEREAADYSFAMAMKYTGGAKPVEERTWWNYRY